MMNEILTFPDRQTFRAWLEKYGAESGGVWLLFGKKGGQKTLSANEALEDRQRQLQEILRAAHSKKQMV